jgi:hypothetical protein
MIGPARAELTAAKEELSRRAALGIPWREHMGEHPGISLGAAFLVGVLLGGSRTAQAAMGKALAQTLSDKVWGRGKAGRAKSS